MSDLQNPLPLGGGEFNAEPVEVQEVFGNV